MCSINKKNSSTLAVHESLCFIVRTSTHAWIIHGKSCEGGSEWAFLPFLTRRVFLLRICLMFWLSYIFGKKSEAVLSLFDQIKLLPSLCRGWWQMFLLFDAGDPLYLYSWAADRGRLVGPSLLWEAGCPPGCPSAARWSSTEPPCGPLGLGPGEEALLHAGSSGRPFGLKHIVSTHTGWGTRMT